MPLSRQRRRSSARSSFACVKWPSTSNERSTRRRLPRVPQSAHWKQRTEHGPGLRQGQYGMTLSGEGSHYHVSARVSVINERVVAVQSDKEVIGSSKPVSNQHRAEKEHSSRALKGHPLGPRPPRFSACPRRPLLAIAAAGLSLAPAPRASVPASAHSIPSTPREWRRHSLDSSLLYQCPSQPTAPPWQLLTILR